MEGPEYEQFVQKQKDEHDAGLALFYWNAELYGVNSKWWFTYFVLGLNLQPFLAERLLSEFHSYKNVGDQVVRWCNESRALIYHDDWESNYVFNNEDQFAQWTTMVYNSFYAREKNIDYDREWQQTNGLFFGVPSQSNLHFVLCVIQNKHYAKSFGAGHADCEDEYEYTGHTGFAIDRQNVSKQEFFQQLKNLFI